MNRSTIDLWVGVLVAMGLAALLFLALKVGNLASFSTSEVYQVQAKFANIGGLKVRAPVKSAGVVVGRVAEVRFDNESYEAVVTMNVESRFQFPKDTAAKILTSGLLGEQYVGLEAVQDGQWDVYFGVKRLGRLHERHMRIEDEYGRLKRCDRQARKTEPA